MANKDSRYNVKLTLGYEIVKADGTKFASFGPAVIDYASMDYLQVCVVQSMVAEFGKALTDTGFAAAAMSGFAAEVEQLKALKEGKAVKEKK